MKTEQQDEPTRADAPAIDSSDLVARTLYLPLKRKWFDLIKSGKKPFEFRLRNDYWTKRLVGKHYDRVVFTMGYPPKDDTSRRIEMDYRGYIETTIKSPEWGNEPKDVFAIYTPCHGRHEDYETSTDIREPVRCWLARPAW